MLKITLLAFCAVLFFPFLSDISEAEPSASLKETATPPAVTEYFAPADTPYMATEYFAPACVPLIAAKPAMQIDEFGDETMRDAVRLNMLTLEVEPTLRDTIRLNMLTIEYEPTLRDTVIEP